MAFLAPDGGDGVREFLRSIGSDRTHPLLDGWLAKHETYRTISPDSRRSGANWTISAPNARFSARFRRDSVPGRRISRRAARDVDRGCTYFPDSATR